MGYALKPNLKFLNVISPVSTMSTSKCFGHPERFRCLSSGNSENDTGDDGRRAYTAGKEGVLYSQNRK
jgi:hypothetical protein